jgi:hypothetical protein
VHHLAERRVREHRVHQLLFGALQVHRHDSNSEQWQADSRLSLVHTI